MKNVGVVTLPSDSFSIEKVLLEKINIDRLLRNNRQCDINSDRYASLEASIRSLERHIKATLKDQGVLITNQIRGLGEDTTDQISDLKKILYEMKEDSAVWWQYEKERDDVMRKIWIKDHPELVKSMSKFPLRLLWQSRDKRPTLHE